MDRRSSLQTQACLHRQMSQWSSLELRSMLWPVLQCWYLLVHSLFRLVWK